jgi:hypothetical protein
MLLMAGNRDMVYVPAVCGDAFLNVADLHHSAAAHFSICGSINGNSFGAPPAHIVSNLGSTRIRDRRVSSIV